MNEFHHSGDSKYAEKNDPRLLFAFVQRGVAKSNSGSGSEVGFEKGSLQDRDERDFRLVV